MIPLINPDDIDIPSLSTPQSAMLIGMGVFLVAMGCLSRAQGYLTGSTSRGVFDNLKPGLDCIKIGSHQIVPAAGTELAIYVKSREIIGSQYPPRTYDSPRTHASAFLR